MNWLRLLEIIDMARRRTGNAVKVDRGWSWVCFCPVCAELRCTVTRIVALLVLACVVAYLARPVRVDELSPAHRRLLDGDGGMA